MRKTICLLVICLSILTGNVFCEIVSKTENELMAIGAAYYQKGDFFKAYETFTDIIRKNPKSENAYLNRGLCLVAMEKQSTAITDFSNVLKINPKSDQAYLNRGACYLKIKQYEKGIEDNKQALLINPLLDIVYCNQGTAYTKTGNYNEAFINFNKAIKLNPFVAEYYTCRGLAYFETGDFGKSAADFQKAVSLQPSNPYYNLCYALFDQRANHSGNELYKKYLDSNRSSKWPAPVFEVFAGKLTPEDCIKKSDSTNARINLEQKCEAYFYLGEYYLMKNDRSKAGEYFRKCIDTGINDFNEYYLAKAELKRLGGKK
jgi:tetratricopeptide (TPR) repeat protein